MDKDNKIQKRREDRKQALQLVYERMFRDDTFEDVCTDALDARDETISDYAKEIIQGIETHLQEIDELISANLKGWKLNRISKISLAAMRISVYEMRMTKEFASDKDGAFVNGVLGAAAKTLNGDK